MPLIRMKNGPLKNQTIEVGEDPITMGRDAGCTVQILDKGASRQHAEIFRIGEMCFIRDLDSRNGSFVNDNRIEEELLREGDRIQIGATLIVFEGDAKKKTVDDSSFEFSEEDLSSTLELRLEDLSGMTAAEGDGSEFKRLRALYRLGRMVGAHAQEAPLVEDVLPFISEQVNADAVYIFTRDPEKGSIAPVGTFTRKDKGGAKISRSIIRRAIQEKRALLVSDAMQDGRFSAQESIMVKEIHSVICCPLSVSGDLQGVLYLATDNPTASFGDDELELAAAMADQIGLAIAHLRSRQHLQDNLMSTIRVLVRAAEMRDPTTRGHSERVSGYAVAVARKLGLSAEVQLNLRLAALLHDIGSLAEGDLADFGRSVEDQKRNDGITQAQVRVRATLDIIADMDCFPQIENAIRYQLERNDGSGPEGKTGDDIPALAQILALAIEFDRMVNSMGTESRQQRLRSAVVELGRQAGRKFDESAVKALIIAHRDGSLHAHVQEAEAASAESPS